MKLDEGAVSMKKKLSPKQEKFCLEYVKTGFAGQAYINAGYKAKSKVVAEANARKLLAKYYIKERIRELMDEIKNKDIADAEEVLRYLTKGMRMELEEEVVVVVNTADRRSEPQIVKKKISIKDANKCAELLGKRYTFFTEKVNVEGNLGVQIVDDIDEDEDVEDDTVV